MKTGKIAAIAMIATAVGGSAFAADLPSRKAPPPPTYVPPPPPIMTWTGFYGGLNLGGGWSANRANPNNFALYGSPVNGATYLLPGNTKGGNSTGGVVGGGQVGYNYQIGSFVLGAETDFQGTSMRSGGAANTALYPDPAGGGALLVPLSPAGNRGIALNWFGTARGRAGLLVAPTLLVYGTGGFAYGNLQSQFTGASSTRTGWTAGGGAEWMFMPNWSAKGEYLFTDLNSGGAQSALAATATDRRHTQYNVVRAGVNYHFNLGGAPSLTSY